MKSKVISKLFSVVLIIWAVLVLTFSSAGAGNLSDNFDGSSINSTLWYSGGYGNIPDAVQQNGRLEMIIPGSSTGTFFSGIVGNFELGGDFTIQIDFNLLIWPFANGVHTGINVAPNYPGTGHGHLVRHSMGTGVPQPGAEGYITNFDDAADVTFVSTTDTLGTLKLVRQDNILSGYYFALGGWTLVDSYEFTNMDDWLRPDFHSWSATPTPFGGEEVMVAFDNLSITYTDLRYNAVPLPGAFWLLGSGLVGLIGLRRKLRV